MARAKKPKKPPDDIPAWFMTYSDVITLLMTFFILLLTFATTEPERFERTVSSTFSAGGATGVAGEKMDGVPKDSWISRVRPPSARISMRGAEMPPITRPASKAAFGEGLRSLNEEEQKQNELTSHSFELQAAELFDFEGNLTPQGTQICSALANQLEALPFQAALQFSDEKQMQDLTGMMEHLFRVEKIRPGQLSMNFVKHGLAKDRIRVLIKRYSFSKN
ncbi:MAG: flagellar motor protein MotB [Mariniblastus sp.]